MDEIGFDFNNSAGWFNHEQEYPYILVKLTPAHVQQLLQHMAIPLRRCYITDDKIIQSAITAQLSHSDVLAAQLPDPGSTMAGDFGEILCYFYQSTKALPEDAYGAKKWRLKQDRTKPAPKSDVVHFVMPNRPLPSAHDVILCSEVKMKSTAGTSTPITSAIEDSEKDRTSRLASTLVWLRERAITEPLGDIDIPLLNRFINLVDHDPVTQKICAVAVICESLLENELLSAPADLDPNRSVIVISVPDLKTTYESIFQATHGSVPI